MLRWGYWCWIMPECAYACVVGLSWQKVALGRIVSCSWTQTLFLFALRLRQVVKFCGKWLIGFCWKLWLAGFSSRSVQDQPFKRSWFKVGVEIWFNVLMIYFSIPRRKQVQVYVGLDRVALLDRVLLSDLSDWFLWFPNMSRCCIPRLPRHTKAGNEKGIHELTTRCLSLAESFVAALPLEFGRSLVFSLVFNQARV